MGMSFAYHDGSIQSSWSYIHSARLKQRKIDIWLLNAHWLKLFSARKLSPLIHDSCWTRPSSRWCYTAKWKRRRLVSFWSRAWWKSLPAILSIVFFWSVFHPCLHLFFLARWLWSCFLMFIFMLIQNLGTVFPIQTPFSVLPMDGIVLWGKE